MTSTEWTETTVGRAAEFLTGFPFASSAYAESGVRLIRGSNVKRGVIDWSSDIARYWPSVDQNLRAFALRDGDIVIAMDGALVGRSFARIVETELPAYLVQRVARLRGKSIDQDLLYQWIKSRDFSTHVDKVKTHTAIPHISPRDIRDFKIWMPVDIEEQHAISAALRDTDDLIATLERLIAKKQAIKQGMMQQLLTGRTRLPGFEDGWSPATISSLSQVTGGGTPSTRVPSYWGGGIPWFTPAEIRAGGAGLVSHSQRAITSDGLANSAASILPAGTVLVTSRASIGHCAVAGVPVTTNQGFTSMVPKDSRSTWFLYYWTQQSRSELESRAAGSTFLEISARKVGMIPIQRPDLDEQAAIGAALRDADREIDALRARLAKARAIKTGMMQELLTGRVRLPVEASA